MQGGMIELHGIELQLPGFALQHVNLRVEEGECFALLGPTGSGKSLVLETIAGLVRPTEGRVFVGDRDVTRLPPEERSVGLVYQDHALFPHLSVEQNIRFGLRYRKMPQGKADERLSWLVSLLGLQRLLQRRTDRLSGGEKQRVSLARALMVEPKVLLLDEPLSALDPAFREEVRTALKELHQELGITFLLVTHDFSEALYLAQRVGVIRRGRLEQVDRTVKVFQQPATPFVAQFVGMKNIFDAVIENGRCRFAGLECPLSDRARTLRGQGHAALRPEDARLFRKGEAMPEDWARFPGVLREIVHRGAHWEARVACGEGEFLVSLDKRAVFDMGFAAGIEVEVSFPLEDLHLMRA